MRSSPPLIERPAIGECWEAEPPGEPVDWAVTFWLNAMDPRTAEQQAKARFTPPTGFVARSTVRPADLSE